MFNWLKRRKIKAKRKVSRKIWEAKNPNRDRKWREENPEKRILQNARSHSNARGVPFNLTFEDIIIPELCPILGITLKFSKSKKTYCSPSIDRIDPKKGYVKGNIQIISLRANMMKSDASPEELKKFAKWVLAEHEIEGKVVVAEHHKQK